MLEGAVLPPVRHPPPTLPQAQSFALSCPERVASTVKQPSGQETGGVLLCVLSIHSSDCHCPSLGWGCPSCLTGSCNLSAQL